MKKYVVVGLYDNEPDIKYVMGYYDTMSQAIIAILDFLYDEEIDLDAYRITNEKEAEKYENYF